MKKTFLLLVSVVGAFALNAQSLVVSNGEDTGLGWWPAGSAGEVGVWDNPASDVINSTAKAMTVWINNDNLSYTGGGMGGLNIDVSIYNTISVMIYKQVEGTVRLELQDGTNSYFVSVDYTTPLAWQKLDFAIPAEIGNITTLLVAPHFTDYTVNPLPEGEAHRMWWDEVVAYYRNPSSISSEDINSKEIVLTQIFSLSGNLVKTLQRGAELNNSDLLKGAYIIKTTDTDGKVVSSKYLKQ